MLGSLRSNLEVQHNPGIHMREGRWVQGHADLPPKRLQHRQVMGCEPALDHRARAGARAVKHVAFCLYGTGTMGRDGKGRSKHRSTHVRVSFEQVSWGQERGF